MRATPRYWQMALRISSDVAGDAARRDDFADAAADAVDKFSVTSRRTPRRAILVANVRRKSWCVKFGTPHLSRDPARTKAVEGSSCAASRGKKKQRVARCPINDMAGHHPERDFEARAFLLISAGKFTFPSLSTPTESLRFPRAAVP